MTLNCLRSLAKIRCDGFCVEVVVVDNGSTDGSVFRIKEYVQKYSRLFVPPIRDNSGNPSIRLIENRANLGFAEGNNVGIKYALGEGADYACLLNNDTRVDPNFLVELVRTAESDGKIGIVGGKIYFEKGYEFHKERYKKEDLGKVIWYAGGKIDWDDVYATHRGVDEVDQGQYDAVSETGYINGCLMLIKREVLRKVGLFDPKYFLYYEDADLSVRAQRAGFKIIYSPWAKIWHLNAGSSGSGSFLHDYFTTRNRMLFGMKYAQFRSKIALLKESLKLLKSGRQWQKIGIRDFYLNKFGKGSW